MFERSWARGEPVVVTGLQRAFQGTWNPSYFTEVYGEDSVTVIDCETDKEHQSTVAEFFQCFGESGLRQRTLKIKVRAFVPISGCPCVTFEHQDWPPQSDFRHLFPELFAAFLHGVPCPDYSRPDGVRNLVSHFAKNGVVPDLGESHAIFPAYVFHLVCPFRP